MNLYSELLTLAGEMAMRQNMPPTDYDDWDWPRGMQVSSLAKVYKASEDADEQCRQWAIRVRSIADRLKQ